MKLKRNKKKHKRNKRYKEEIKKKEVICSQSRPIFRLVYYCTTLPIIHTGWKISLHLQIYVLVDLENMGRNIYKTSTYNRNQRVNMLPEDCQSYICKSIFLATIDKASNVRPKVVCQTLKILLSKR